jgi:hypothetical protein
MVLHPKQNDNFDIGTCEHLGSLLFIHYNSNAFFGPALTHRDMDYDSIGSSFWKFFTLLDSVSH